MSKPNKGVSEADRLAIELATLELPLSDASYRRLGECSALGQAALLLAMDDSALQAWYEAGAPRHGSISRMLARAVDLDDVADRIDATISEDETVIADLCRAQVTWSNPTIAGLLDHPATRMCAAWMLSQTEFEPLLDWLDGDRAPDELVDVARGVASSGLPELFEALAPWLGAIRDDAPEAAAQIEGALFVLSPESWGRGFLRGQWDGEFLSDSVAMADILCATGQSYWSGALAAFDPASDEFGAIARMVASGAAANLHFGADDPSPAVINAFYVEDWATLAAHPAFTIACTLAEEDSWQQPLLEAAAHDLLMARAIETPGIAGLPLSSSHPDADEIALAQELPDQPDVDPIALVATICDVEELRAIPDFDPLAQAYAELAAHPHPVVASAASQLATPASFEADLQTARDETTIAFAAAERIARRATPEALHALIDLWADGPVLRVGLASALLHQELRAMALQR